MTIFRSGLFRKYAAVFLLLVGSMVLVGGGVELALNYRDSRNATAALQSAEARGASIRIDEFLAGIRAQASEVAALPWLIASPGMEDRRQEYLRLLKLASAISELRHLDELGRERLRVSRDERDRVDSLETIEDPAFLSALRTRGFALSRTYFRVGSEPYVKLGVAERATGGATVAEINLKFVGDVVSRIRVGDAGKVFVLDEANHVIAHPNLSLVLRKPDLGSSALVRELKSAAAQGESARGVAVEGIEGGQVIASASSVPVANWLVVVEQPRAEVLKPVYDALLRTSLLMVAGLLAALLAGYVQARRLARPIIDVRLAAERISRGDLAARIDVKTGDEVEALAIEFNRMAEQLQDYTTGLERKVDEKTAKLQDAMRARALFLAAASHDLRQPLYAISILADTLALHEMPEAARQTLAKQREAIAVLRGLFDNLLDLSRFDSGDVRAADRVVSLREILMSVAMEHEIVSRAKGLEWHSEIPDVQVRTDPELLRRLVGNLLSNAVRYTPKGSVRLVAKVEGPAVKLEVADTGIGIPLELQGKVFEEFVQIDNPSRERDRGVGLGLSIVRKIDRLLGSGLTLESRPGEGTRLTLAIPLAEAPLAPVEARTANDVATADLAGMRVWVIEDDPMVRDALAGQFAAWGVDHAFASTRAEVSALRDGDGDWPDAAILDDMLGHGERGLEIGRWLASEMPKARIVVVSGNVDPEGVEQLHGSDLRVLRKPLSAVVLAQWLHEALRSPRD